MRVAIPILLTGALVGLILLYFSNALLPSSQPDASPVPPLVAPVATAEPQRAIVTTVTVVPVSPTPTPTPLLATPTPTPTPSPPATPALTPARTLTPTPTLTPAPTVITSTEGAPLNAVRVIAALQGAGIAVIQPEPGGGRFVAEIDGVRQAFSLLVYSDTAELQRQWNVQPGAPPQPRVGVPPALAYWNQNAVLAFPDGYNNTLARRIAEVFLSLQ